MTEKAKILTAISREEALLVKLDRQREEALGRLHSLQAELKSPHEISPDDLNQPQNNPSLKSKSRREVMERLSDIPENEKRLILATGRYIGEGFDARLDTLFLAMPCSNTVPGTRE